MAQPSRRTTRITINLPNPIAEAISEWAAQEERPVAGLLAYLVEQNVRSKYPDRFPPEIEIKDSTNSKKKG